MKTKYWILLLVCILVVCAGFSIPMLTASRDASRAQIISDGKIIHTVELHADRQIRITTADGGSNTVTVKDGRIGVTEANCPDHYCMDRGMCSGGTQIVCLPNRLVIRFPDTETVDTMAG